MTRPILALFLGASSLWSQWRVMPLPASIRPGQGRLTVPRDFGIAFDKASVIEPRAERAIRRIRERLSSSGAGPSVFLVRIAGESRPVQSLEEDESYRLEINSSQALLTAPNGLGAMHGLETFYQLLEKTDTGWSAAAVTIDDHPRFAWRGLMLDVCRHFMPLNLVRRTLDGMAAVKLNVFHWHLSDEQGFRVESKLFPRLHELGSDGNYYTQEEVRGIVEYARDRGIRVVPEFDVPGHSASWLVGYPELAAGPGPFQIVRTWGITDPAMDPANPAVYAFLDKFMGEMATLFPDAYFHIGGDEVNGKQWSANNTDIPAFMQSHGFKTQHDLQAYFNQQLQAILANHGKRMEGWDEILNPNLPKSIVIQSWRGAKSLEEAAAQGFQGILSSGYYLDHMESAAKLYSVHPPDLPGVLGGEVCMWTEYVSPENVESRLWPRSAAVAERLWSPAVTRDVPDMYRRLALMDRELDALGMRHNANCRIMLERLAGSKDIEALQVLTDVLEPGSVAVRHHANPNYTQTTPLNRLVDTARPDSAVARHFAELVDRYAAHRNDTAAREEIRKWLKLWAGNHAKLQPLIAKSPILGEAAPVSAALSRMAASALAHKRVPVSTKPVSEVTIAVASPIQRLMALPVF
jgi:hexosaminidase